jgi:hypothetical protein
VKTAIPGLLIAVLGGSVSVHSYTRWFLEAGDARPGMMILGCGALLLVFGLAILFLDVAAARVPGSSSQPEPIGDEEALAIDGEPDPRSMWFSLALTLGAICAFAIVAPTAGIFAAIAVVCVMIAVQARFKSIIRLVLLIVLLMAFVYLVFIFGLKLPMKVMP